MGPEAPRRSSRLREKLEGRERPLSNLERKLPKTATKCLDNLPEEGEELPAKSKDQHHSRAKRQSPNDGQEVPAASKDSHGPPADGTRGVRPMNRVRPNESPDDDDALYLDPHQPIPKSFDTAYIYVSQWLESTIGSECHIGQPRSRRNSDLQNLVGGLNVQKIPRSVPAMEQDVNGHPLTLASNGSRPRPSRPIEPSDYNPSPEDMWLYSKIRPVDQWSYRHHTLEMNGIYILPDEEHLPKDVDGLVSYMARDRDSPSPSLDELRQNQTLHQLAMGVEKGSLASFFRDNILPCNTSVLKVSYRTPMCAYQIPHIEADYEISTPVPDILYGYDCARSFVSAQRTQLIDMELNDETGLSAMEPPSCANDASLLYPFFLAQFAADGPAERGSMWVTTNEYLGGAATCISIAESFNRQLKQSRHGDRLRPVDTAVFSVAVRGTEARLYVPWKHGERKYYTRAVDSFLLHKPKDFVELRKYVHNIIDWGSNKRLNDIKKSLDILIEEGKKPTPEIDESHSPPRDDGPSEEPASKIQRSIEADE